MLSTTFGVAVFVSLLGLCAHLLLDLWIRSTVEDVAATAAARVATSEATDDHLPAVQAEALARARHELGNWARRVHLEFQPDPSGRTVRLHVRSERAALVPIATSALPLPDPLDMVIVRRRELPGSGR
jgi:hypothetical protein